MEIEERFRASPQSASAPEGSRTRIARRATLSRRPADAAAVVPIFAAPAPIAAMSIAACTGDQGARSEIRSRAATSAPGTSSWSIHRSAPVGEQTPLPM